MVSKKTERGGFEPPDPGLAGQLLSREPDSASLAPFHFLNPEREGFEPPVSCPTAVFKTATIDHSDISPIIKLFHIMKVGVLCQYAY